jgi:exopolysaccharide biosynthesis polyprenyl glycosylphosphotransferase
VAALRNSELELSPSFGVSPLPALRNVAPALDVFALCIGVVVSLLQPELIYASILVFVALNLDGDRACRLDPHVSDEVGWLLVRVLVPMLGVAVLAQLGLLPGAETAVETDRLVLASATAALLVVLGRAVAYAVARAAKSRRLIGERTVIVGTGPIALELADALAHHPEYGLGPIGFIDAVAAEDLPHPLLGAPEDIARVVREFHVRRIIVAFGGARDGDVARLLRSLEAFPVEVHAVPRFFELGSTSPGDTDNVRGIPLVHLKRPALRRPAAFAKRALDVVVSAVLLVILAPVLAIAAATVKLSSPGPVLFRQIRSGRGGRRFLILKFRTMYVDPDEGADPGGRRSSFTVEHHRVTPVGKILRRSSIDELPQLINVLRGDMSLVGPRPEVPHYVEEFSAAVPAYSHRLRVAGGITGLAQVHGRSRGLDSIPERARLDNLYVETRSLWGDIVLIFRTIEVVFRGDRQCE